MAEKTLAHVQERTKEGRLVIPLDHIRAFDYQYTLVAATTTKSGAAYTACSGKDVYVKQWIVTEYSGTDGLIRLNDASGPITPYIPVAANTCVTLDPRPAAIGPLHAVANDMNVFYNTDGAFYGAMTLVVKIDPKVDE